ncbi:MAG: class I SAM-dependent methyltransferase [Lachnospiraceae bacterium]|nr:class I SAM-dependent methyltransferase [Lachnospiraceae bacterium]
MELSKRLQTIADMVSEGNRLVDIGTDHGYIPIDLLRKGKIPTAIAMDVGVGPLERARDHIQAYCLADKAVCRLSDGFKEYQQGEADTAVIAGMGGDLMSKILEEGSSKLPEELILQPQSEWFKVRIFLQNHEYKIVEEEMLKEDGKYYVVIKAVCGSGETLNESEILYGPYLLAHKHPVLQEYLQYTKHTLEKILANLEQVDTESAKTRKIEIQTQLDEIKGACTYFE